MIIVFPTNPEICLINDAPVDPLEDLAVKNAVDKGCPAFGNAECYAESTCPDGGVFTYTLPAGTISGCSALQVQETCLSLAQNRANSRRFCCPFTPPNLCIDTDCDIGLILVGGTAPFTWVLTGGSLPTGVTLAAVSGTGRTMKFTGTPSFSGTYSATYVIIDATGNYLTKVFTFGVIEILPLVLPDATTGTPYSEQLSVTGALPGATVTFFLSSGTLPGGLILDAAGLISGTPDGTGLPATFTVGVQIT